MIKLLPIFSLLGLAVSQSVLADKEHLGIYMNQKIDTFTSYVDESEKLILLYVCHTGLDPDTQP